MTIVFFARFFPPGWYAGVGRFHSDLAHGLAERGHSVHVIAGNEDEKEAEFRNGIWVHHVKPRLPADMRRWPHLTWFQENAAFAWAAYQELNRIRETTPVDIVQVPISNCEGMFCVHDPALRTVLAIHTTIKFTADTMPASRGGAEIRSLAEIERLLLRCARYIESNGEAIVERIQTEYGIVFDRRRLAVIPHGSIDRAPSAPSPARASIEAPIRVLFVGRLEARKGIDVLLEAIRTLQVQRRVDFQIVGDNTSVVPDGHGTYMARFRSDSRPLPQNVTVSFEGFVPECELNKFYAGCDVFVAPSRYESFGLIFLEAMMFSKPVIGCDAGGVPDVVRHGDNGLLAKPGDVASLKAALETLIEDSSLRERYGGRSREIYAAEYTNELMVARTEQFFRSIVAEPQLSSGDSKSETRPPAGELDLARNAICVRAATLQSLLLAAKPALGWPAYRLVGIRWVRHAVQRIFVQHRLPDFPYRLRTCFRRVKLAARF